MDPFNPNNFVSGPPTSYMPYMMMPGGPPQFHPGAQFPPQPMPFPMFGSMDCVPPPNYQMYGPPGNQMMMPPNNPMPNYTMMNQPPSSGTNYSPGLNQLPNNDPHYPSGINQPPNNDPHYPPEINHPPNSGMNYTPGLNQHPHSSMGYTPGPSSSYTALDQSSLSQDPTMQGILESIGMGREAAERLRERQQHEDMHRRHSKENVISPKRTSSYLTNDESNNRNSVPQIDFDSIFSKSLSNASRSNRDRSPHGARSPYKKQTSRSPHRANLFSRSPLRIPGSHKSRDRKTSRDRSPRKKSKDRSTTRRNSRDRQRKSRDRSDVRKKSRDRSDTRRKSKDRSPPSKRSGESKYSSKSNSDRTPRGGTSSSHSKSKTDSSKTRDHESRTVVMNKKQDAHSDQGPVSPLSSRMQTIKHPRESTSEITQGKERTPPKPTTPPPFDEETTEIIKERDSVTRRRDQLSSELNRTKRLGEKLMHTSDFSKANNTGSLQANRYMHEELQRRVAESDLKIEELTRRQKWNERRMFEWTFRNSTKHDDLVDDQYRDMETKYWCDSCEQHCGNQINSLLMHFRSTKHQKLLESAESPWSSLTPDVNDKHTQKIVGSIKGVELIYSANGFFCDVCQEFYGSGPSVLDHFRSAKHNHAFQDYTKSMPFYQDLLEYRRTLKLVLARTGTDEIRPYISMKINKNKPQKKGFNT